MADGVLVDAPSGGELSEPIEPLLAGNWLSSPCVGICQTDHSTGWCGGCGRSAGEMAAWSELPSPLLQRVWSDLPRRNAILGLGYQLLPWTGPLLLERLAERSRLAGAVWRIGVPGAMAMVEMADGRLSVAIRDGALLLSGPDAQAAIRPTPGTRAFRMLDPADGREHIVLALHRVRFKQPPATTITFLGFDGEALDPARREAGLVDLGLAHRSIRFCIRSRDRALTDLLRDHEGDVFARSPALHEAIARYVPDLIVSSLLGRIELIGTGARGAGATLEPALLAGGRELEPGLQLPPDYVPCARLVRPGRGT